jgi:hypothetical protein
MNNLKLICLLFVSTSFFAISSCEKTECCVIPAVAELHGNWRFVRVNYGFTNTSQTATELGYTERLEIDGTNERFRRYRDKKEIENTPFALSEQGNSKVITFEKEQNYSYYTVFIENGKTMLSLYERSPVGAVLADGGMYYYEQTQ